MSLLMGLGAALLVHMFREQNKIVDMLAMKEAKAAIFGAPSISNKFKIYYIINLNIHKYIYNTFIM